MAVFSPSTLLVSHHKTFVHDASADASGRFLATCSSDRTVRVYRNLANHEASPRWSEVCSATDHTASIHKVVWTKRVFGVFLATASADRTIIVYQLLVTKVKPSLAAAADSDSESTYELIRSAQILLYNRDTLLDVAFSPKQFGMWLAVSCRDGSLRVFDAVDKQREVAAFAPAPPSSQSIEGPVTPAATPIGRADSTTTFEEKTEAATPTTNTTDRLGAPMRRSHAFATGDVKKAGDPEAPPHHHPALRTISWCPSLTEARVLIACGSVDGTVVVRSYDTLKRTWEVVQFYQSRLQDQKGLSAGEKPSLAESGDNMASNSNIRTSRSPTGGAPFPGFPLNLSHLKGVNAVRWAPNLGRSYDLLATVCPDSVHIVRFVRDPRTLHWRASLWVSETAETFLGGRRGPEALAGNSQSFASGSNPGSHSSANLRRGPDQYCSASWNASGTLLIVSTLFAEVLVFHPSDDGSSWSPLEG
jgi:protein transport protein SEC13